MLLSRRALLIGSTALAVAPAHAAVGGTIRLRLLETSDLHMFVYDFDYYRDKPDATVGLSKVATLIRAARAQARNVLLFDNGDIIQGNPLGDYEARDGVLKPGETHPMFAAMNLLGYDCATLGNHEFNYGLPFLERALAGANFPFVCANLAHVDGRSYLPPTMVLERELVSEDGGKHRLRIGVIGFLPPQIMVWDKSNLEGHVTTTDIVEAARKHVPALRAQCDVLVALCHSGIETSAHRTGFENASFHLAAVPGIDVIFTGHSHRVFPGPDYAGRPGVDAVRGTLAGVPAVMPGFWGSHLGIVDLVLAQQDGRWKVTDFAVEARPIYKRDQGHVIPMADADPAILAAVAPAHRATIDWVRQPVGQVAFPLNSYFALLGSEASVGVVNEAQTWYTRRLLAGGEHANLPILSAAAPFKAGGTGPDSFIDIAPGKVALREVADLYMFANTLVAVKLKGAQVAEWLERSCAVLNHIDPARGEAQDLLNRFVPSYNFDVISGVTYRIDLTQPNRYDKDGKLVRPQARRIVDLRFEGKPIDPAREFVVVTNNYRSDGGGQFPGLDGSNVVLRAPDLNRDAIVRYFETKGTLRTPPAETWSFAPPPRRLRLAFRSAERLAALLGGRQDVVRVGAGQDGYVNYELLLG
jgi:2',3'-cyclic-nucleotide 2'-phosphodiesterase/3'-nucleotidase